MSRLPKSVLSDIDVLLGVTKHRPRKTDRWAAIGAGGYSSDAKRWRAVAAFSRLAVEFLGLPTVASQVRAHPSYRILETRIHVSTYSTTARGMLPVSLHTRTLGFSWTIESLVTDLEWFTFPLHDWYDGLKFKSFTASGPDDCCRTTRHVSKPYGWSLYILLLQPGLPTGVPIELRGQIVYHKADKARPVLVYVPPRPTKRLVLSCDTAVNLGEQPKSSCTVLDKFQGEALKQLTPKIVVKETTDLRPLGGDGVVETRREIYRVPSPRAGRCYELGWRRRSSI
jgi:hypothetical protein